MVDRSDRSEMAGCSEIAYFSYNYRLMAVRPDGKPVKLLVGEDRDLIHFLAHDLAAGMKLPLEMPA